MSRLSSTPPSLSPLPPRQLILCRAIDALRRFRRVLPGLLLALTVGSFAGCKAQNATIISPMEDVNQPTEGWGLRKLDPKDYPDMRAAWMDKTGLEHAIDKSLQFLHAPSSVRFYPSGNPGDTITHAQIVATLDDMKNMLHQNISADQFQQQVIQRFDVYTSVGYNGKGDVWFTGYFTPIYHGSRTRTGEYQYPIYSRPTDLQSDPLTGMVRGDYPTRRELMTSGKLRGLELLYFKKPLEPFMIQVQGSAEVILTNGEVVYVGFSGSNGRQHVGLGTQLLNEKVFTAKNLSLTNVMDYFDKHPERLNDYVMRDDRMTFQKIYTAAEQKEWPTGSINVQVTPDRSIATDKNGERAIFPRASLTFLEVDRANNQGQVVPYKGLLLDQDNGGGIRAAGRADIYMGIGELARQRAGQQFAQGRLYYIFLKPELISSGNYPDLKPVAPPAPRVTPGNNPPRPAPPVTSPTRGNRPTGGDEMFPGAVRRP
jgi:membrane-bound lytic murein transglycosylase A